MVVKMFSCLCRSGRREMQTRTKKCGHNFTENNDQEHDVPKTVIKMEGLSLLKKGLEKIYIQLKNLIIST